MTVSYGQTPIEQGLPRIEELRRRGGGSLLVEAGAERALGRFLAMQGEFDEAREHMRRGIGILSDLGLVPMATASSGQGLAFVELLAGDEEAAERALRASYDRLGELGEQSFRSTTAATLAEVLYERGEFDEAERFTGLAEEAAAARDISSQVQLRAVRARILARRGALEEAERLALEAVDLVRSSDFLNLKAATLLALADVLRQADRRDEAATLGAEALALLDAKGNRALADRVRQVFPEPAAERE